MFCANFTKDEEFVERFKKEHNEQFYVLVKMHLSFLLDMTTEESECFYEKVKQKRWNLVPFGKKSRNKTLQEGATLSPDVLTKIHPLIDFLKVDNRVQSDGIFRRTGSIERQHELKNALLQGSNVNFDGFTVHDCASVLKGFLADLPEPLTTDIQFPLYCQIAETFHMDNANHQSKILQTIQLLFLLLPKTNKSLLQDIFELLHLVAMNESSNRMSPDNLAKLFTPHLLCPRKLSPENLLKDSQSLFGVVAFMITKYTDLCKIPASLMLDFKSHYDQGAVLNESVKGAAHTVFTFVDNKLTAKENEENVTDAALAELYAHIQSLPESSKKRKLVKQFNKQNGHGTPLQVIRSTAPKTNKSFGDSIKKHMFHKKILKNAKLHAKNSSGDDLLESPSLQQKTPSRGRLFCHNFDSSSEDEETVPKKLKSSEGSPLPRTRRKSDPEFSLGEAIPSQYLTSTPACIINRTEEVFTPEGQGRKSMSPITRSAQRMSRAMQETMMTPRSRKPVLLVSGTNINNLAKLTPALTHLQEEDSESCIIEPSNTSVYTPKQQLLIKSKSEGELRSAQSGSNKINKTDSPKTLSDTFKQYLSSRDILTSDSMTDLTFSSRSDDFQSQEGNFSDSMMFVLDGNVPENGDDESMSDSEVLVLFGHIYSLLGKPRPFLNQHVAVKTCEHVADFCLTASIVIIIVYLPKNGKNFFQFFTSLYPEGNQLFGPLLAMKKHHFWRNLLICNVCIGALITFDASFFLIHFGWDTYKYLIFGDLQFYVYNLALLLLLALARKLELRFAELNELLEYKTEHFLKSNSTNKKPENEIETHLSFILNSEHFYSVRTFRIMHYDLCKLVKRFNEMFGRIILSTVVFSIANILAKVTFIIDFYVAPSVDEEKNKWAVFMGIVCFWICANMSQSFLIAFYGEQITKEGEKTTRICFYLLNKVSFQLKNDDEKLVKDELNSFAFQSYTHIPCLSAGGFFDVNFKVLGLMISSVTSYLMVIIQFLLRPQNN